MLLEKENQRRITHRTRGHRHGPITRLMSPSDLGNVVKPFVFLDIFNAEGAGLHMMENMPIHPHSGIATVTVFTDGQPRYDDPASGSGVLSYGGVEWMRAGRGVWHGKELSPGDSTHIRGFQLWIALPPELELSEPQSRYIEAKDMRQSGPAYVILGSYDGVQSPVSAPDGINYLLVTLKPGETWRYRPPTGHSVGWLAVASGALNIEDEVVAGEMVVFENADTPIVLEATGSQDAVFVLGSAIPHPHKLHLGPYSVHTTADALGAGERHIAELGQKLHSAGDRKTSSGTTPVYR